MANSLEVKEIGKDNPNNESDYSIDSKKVKANQFVSKASTQIDPKDQIISNEGDIQLSCDQCNYKTLKKKYLVRHIKIHIKQVKIV